MTTRYQWLWHCLHGCTLAVATLLALASPEAAAGLLAEATRIIYPAGANARTLTLTNTNDWPVVVQTWFDHGEGDPDVSPAPPFIALPAIFRLAPGGVQTLRILHTGEPLPPGRESVYWFNLYEIPPAAPMSGNDARLDLAINTQLKLYYRPDAVAEPDHLAEQLRFSLMEENGYWHIECHNPTPWHASFAGLSVDGVNHGTTGALHARQDPDMMTPPHSSRRYPITPGQPKPDAPVRFSLIDDGGFAHEHTGRLRQAR